MPSELTIAQVVTIGDITVYLMGNYQAKQEMFGGSKVLRSSPMEIAFLTDALRWGNDGGAQTAATLRGIADYNIWLMGMFQLQAQNILYGPGGGSTVDVPVVTAGEFPIYVTSDDFATSTQYNDTRLEGEQIAIFINEVSQQWMVASPTTFEYTLTGINILVPGFDADTFDYTIMIQRYTSAQPTGGSGDLLLGAFYYGDTDYYSDLIANNDIVPYNGSFSSTIGDPISVGYPLAASDPAGKYLVIRIPNTQTDKSAWSNTGTLNTGAIPDSVFREIISFGDYDYYCTRITYVFDPSFLTMVLT